MSVSSLPEWKQLLLEKKRREEEERERREKEEEAKFASMPAWKRGIIQRRKAKLDSSSDKDRDVCLLQVDARSPSDCLSDTDSFITANFGSDLSLSPDPGLWLDAISQVSMETIVPFHENPFIRTQSAKRRGREAEVGSDPEVKEKEKDKSSPRGQEAESGRGRDIEFKIERFRDLSEGREKERSRDRSQGREQEKNKESSKDQVREQELLQVRKEERETDPPSTSSSPLVPCLRTIRAENIIIIEQDRKGTEERRGRWKDAESERSEDDHQGKRGMKVNLREILSGGGSVTEIRASEVLIIKPPASPEERTPVGGGGKGSGREDGEMKGSIDGRKESLGREYRTDMSWLREKERERPWGQATVIKEEKKENADDNVFVEKGGRVSQLLSKFGQHPKPPSRSKSSDNFLRPGRRKYSEDEDGLHCEDRKADGRSMMLKGVPKRSFSFSDRVISTKENGLDGDGFFERKTRESIHSEKSAAPWVDLAGREIRAKLKLGYTQLMDKNRVVKDKDGHFQNEEQKGGPVIRRKELDVQLQHKSEAKKAEAFDTRASEKQCDAQGEDGFTVAAVKNTEGISFARRVPIRQDGKARAERDVKRLVEKKAESEGQIEKCSDFKRDDGFESVNQPESAQKSHIAALVDLASSGQEGQYRYELAFKECSNLLCTIPDGSRDANKGLEWSGTHGSYLAHSVLSKQTEELISKIEKIGDTTVYNSDKLERLNKAACEMPKENKQELQSFTDADSEHPGPDIAPRSPKRIMGNTAAPLEIQIPRTVFYVAEEMEGKKRAEGQIDDGKDWEAGVEVERRDSWRIGKPLSRIESLREKIRQREIERRRQKATQDEDEEEERADTAGDRFDDREAEIEKEREAAACARQKQVEAEKGPEDAVAQTPMTAFDVKQEVSVLKTSPQLPVSVLNSQAVGGEEVTSGYAAPAAEDICASFQTTEEEEYPLKDVEEQVKHHRSQQEKDREEERKEEEQELTQKEVVEQRSPQSISPLPQNPSPLAAMSRIYNLDTVGSRSGLCVRERTVDLPPVHLVKVRPLMSNASQSDNKELSDEDNSGLQSIQQQIGQFQFKESCASTNPLDVRGTRGPQATRSLLKHLVKDNDKTPEKDFETTAKEASQRASSPTSRLKPSNQTISPTPSILRSTSPDTSSKSSDCIPTPSCTPVNQSPAQSPSVSPCTTPSPTLFSIKSASGGQVKRGATITISPRKTTGGGVTGSTTGSTTAGSSSAKTSQQQAQASSAATEAGKKKYPTVEEIQVIGGYQNLDKSCLVKNRGTPKRVKVCFDEDRLEQVCEYPSETSMLASTPFPHDVWKTERAQSEDTQEEEPEMEGLAMLSKGTRSVGISTGRGLRVGQFHPFLRKHKV